LTTLPNLLRDEAEDPCKLVRRLIQVGKGQEIARRVADAVYDAAVKSEQEIGGSLPQRK
jgi:hypothetical protein